MPGLYLSTGYSGHGFGIGPGAGRLAADLIAGDPPIVDPHPFRYSRMIDGTRSRRAGDDVISSPSFGAGARTLQTAGKASQHV